MFCDAASFRICIASSLLIFFRGHFRYENGDDIVCMFYFMALFYHMIREVAYWGVTFN